MQCCLWLFPEIGADRFDPHIVGVLFLSKDFRLLALIPIIAVIGIVLAPQAMIDRGKSIFDPTDLTSRDRIAMLQAGVSMVRDYPLTGVGPRR